MERRLSAIFAADMVGYSRLMEADEVGTVERQKTHRRELIDPQLRANSGRIVKELGDGILAEFPSVVLAVKCAITIQRAMREREAAVPQDRRICYRIGIHLGDIIHEGGDIVGDGVNIAARLEGLAEPGSICISQQVFDQLGNKLEADFSDLGEKSVKNISRPIRVYQVRLDGNPPLPLKKRSVLQVPLLTAAALILGVLVLLGIWLARSSPTTGETPRVAVLPFQNIDGDEDSRRISEGIEKDITFDLAGFPELNVIARDSTKSYRNSSPDLQKISEQLGAEFVLGGSVQRDSDRFRITARLIETEGGRQIWAERWDRPADDIFEIQSEIAQTVANRVGGGAGAIQQKGRNAARRKRPSDLNAYELYLLGTEKIERLTKADLEDAIQLLNRAIALDRNFARAYVELYHANEILSAFDSDNRDLHMQAAIEAAEQAVTLDPSDAEAHAVFAMSLFRQGEIESAKASFEKSLSLAPSSFEILTFYANYAGRLGDPVPGASMAEKAIQLNPNYPTWSGLFFAWAFLRADRYQDAIRVLDRQPSNSYRVGHWIARAIAHAGLGEMEEAKQTTKTALSKHPKVTIDGFVELVGLDRKMYGHLIEFMRQAGFPQ